MEVWEFARNQFIFNTVNYFSRNLDNMLIGRYLGASELGYYDKGYQTTIYPNQLLTGVLNPVIQPIMSEYETDKEVIRKVYLRVVRLLGDISLPLSVFCFFAAEDIIYFLYGDQWGSSIMTLQILSVSIWAQMIASSTGAFYQSANRTDLLLISGIQSSIFNISFIIYGVYIGTINPVATMVLISFTVNFFINNYLLVKKALLGKYSEVFKALMKPMILGSIQLLIFIFLPELNFSPFINLIIQGLTFIFGLIVGSIVTGQFKEIKNMIFN